MAVCWVVVVAGPVEVGRHQADGIKAVLAAQGLTELDARDLGDGIPLIGGFERPGEQGFLTDGLGGELGIDAAAAQKQQAANARAPGGFDHMGLDLEIVKEEIGGVGAVGADAAHLRRRQHHYRGLVLGKPTLHRCWIE